MRDIDFLNLNSQRNYPFADDANRFGNFTGVNERLRNDFLLDMSITTDKENIYLKKIDFTMTTITLHFHSNDDDSLVCTCTVSKVNFIAPQKIPTSGTPGEVVFGEGVNKYNLTNSVTFFFDRTRIIDSLIRKNQHNNVTSLTIDGNIFTGDIILKEGFNTRFEVDEASRIITIFAERDAGKGDLCIADCIEPEVCDDGLKFLNGLRPDPAGNFNIIPLNRATVKNFHATNTIEIGTLIPIDRLTCIRPATPGPVGPPGAKGATGPPGNTPSPFCANSEQCITCNTAENLCGNCNTCETCNTCEVCNNAENITTTGGGGGTTSS